MEHKEFRDGIIVNLSANMTEGEELKGKSFNRKQDFYEI